VPRVRLWYMPWVLLMTLPRFVIWFVFLPFIRLAWYSAAYWVPFFPMERVFLS